MDVVEKKLGITGKESSSHDLQQTTSSLPKRRLEHGSESVNEAKARQDEEPSSSKALSVEAKEKEVKEGKEELKEKELKEKANKGLEKALAKAKEAKANEAKAKEAKAKEKEAKAKEKEAKAKEKEAKAKEKEAKEKEEKEAKLAAEDWLGEAKLEEEAKAKEAADKAKEPDESAAEASVVLMDKDEDTVSDVKMHEARRLAKKDSALAAIRGRSERDRKLAPSQQSPFQGNNTAKLIIPNTKHMDAYINVLRLRQRNNPNHFRSERICFLDHLFSQMWRDKYGEFKSSEPDHNGLGRRLSGGSWDLYAGIVPTFYASNKTWGVDIDEIYAPVNFQNDHWIAIWISIPKRHIVVWDSIVKHISKAQLDEIMEPFLTMVPYLLVECASTDEERIKYSLEPFTYERQTVGVPQCIAGDCGVYALKYMECHALGYTPFPAAFCEKNVKQIREKMAHDIFHETPGFEGIEDKSSYYNDLDTYG
ncbi:hypothetical protein N665_1277s0007 [Sinapis alba]|nr:hypothetical protein N665_1277s0007 [Sinapis alba]